MARSWARYGERLSQKLLMPEEQAALRGHARPANRIAKSFAAKEAFVKALGTGFEGVGYRDCGVARDERGRPFLIFSVDQQQRLATAGIARAHLALTDQDGWVLAMVVLEADG